MNAIKKIIFLLLLSLMLVQCSNKNEYLIKKGNVGLLNTNTTIQDLQFIFANDSIVSHLADINENEEDSFFNANDEYEIFSEDGHKLLSIVPVEQNDSTSTLKSIQLFGVDYSTEKGISLQSTFKDINTNYKINKVETTLNSATLYIDELNATIAIDKEELGISKFSREEISLDQIPDVSKIKYFTIWFN
ncbi:hypothetical protein ACFQ5N_02805 [Lutibacter holmesii]|uniref:Lipoprotein n=1 Tax=Lutibacter holmesii TaxID=1137985 RepID=A0ABW3WK02_9FLAO